MKATLSANASDLRWQSEFTWKTWTRQSTLPFPWWEIPWSVLSVIGVCRSDNNVTNQDFINLKSPPFPNVTKCISMDTAWKDHLIKSLDDWMHVLNDYKFDETCQWNEHLIPQVEFLRGYHLSALAWMYGTHEWNLSIHFETVMFN
jgi:hypothetical protein